MKNYGSSISKFARIMAMEAGLVLAVATLVPVATAQDKQARIFSAKAGQIVNDAVLAKDENKYDLTISLLKEALESKTLSIYETAMIYQLLGSSLYELNQYKDAVDAFEAAISSGGLLPNEATNLRLNIAQLLIANGKPAEGAQMLEDWAVDGGVLQPNHIAYLWQAWSQAEQYDRALPWAEKWFANAKPKDAKHYETLYFFYDTLNMTHEKQMLLQQMDISLRQSALVLRNRQ
ncbi:MAG: hypothetical protein L3J65_10575 [Robiginitomaculum sp.]|nr:hypothetical protein [Robiginitomaculum sp.]